jgi:hypothetical protein
MPKDIQIYKVRDPAEKFYKSKGLMFDLPMRLIVSGKSYLSGKTNLLTNLLLQDDKRLYRNSFKGDNIYIFSGSLHQDNKMQMIIKELDIPDSNLFDEFEDEVLDVVLDHIQDEFEEEKKHSLILLDDLSFGGALKAKTNGALSRLFCNARHFGCSVFLTAQRYCDLPTCVRENATGAILFKCPERVMETILADHNYLENKKDFMKMFRTVTNEKHAFLCVNYSNDSNEMYMNHHFKPIGKCGKEIGNGCNCSEIKEKEK